MRAFSTDCRWSVGLAVISMFVTLHVADAVADDPLRDVQQQFTDTIQPLLQSACADCHSGDGADADFNIDSYQTLDQILSAHKKWAKVEHRVAAKEMPPEDSDSLSDSDYKILMQWLDDLLHSVDCTNINPGRVTLRRLNRTEYRNTVRDLIGVDYKPAADFPGDDVGYGFDNIADVISLPPILMEKYFNAAESITAAAIVDPDRPAFNRRFGSEQFKIDGGGSHNDNNVLLYTEGTIRTDVNLPANGKYKISIRAYGSQGGDERVKLSAGFGNSKSVKRNCGATKNSIKDIDVTVRGRKGKCRLEIAFLNDATGKDKNGKRFDRNLHVQQVRVTGPLNALPPSHRTIFSAAGDKLLAESKKPKGTNGSQDADSDQRKIQTRAARKIINVYASKAFRRRATSQELNRLVDFYERARNEGDNFETAMRLPFQVLLVSPHFLYKIESPVAPGETRFLSDFELATSLSYFLWSTMPDDELFKVAASGKLRHTEVLRSQVKRMLADPKAVALVDNFVSQWLQLRHLEDFQPDPDLFPDVDQALRRDMITETQMVFSDFIKHDRSVTDLLETDYTFVNERLAKFYQWDSVSGDAFLKVSTEDSGRRGFLTHASILTLTSNPTRTSPVKRGKWIMENLLGEEPPPPDPSVMKLEDQAELTGTVRQRLEQHRADPNCAVCHKVMDELGFALENYDAVGRWRDLDDGIAIDAAGILPDGSEFTGAWEMQQTILHNMREPFVRCLTEKMLTYATGRGIEYYDVCAVDKIMEAMERGDYRFSDLVYQVVTSAPFLKRRGEIDSTDSTDSAPSSSSADSIDSSDARNSTEPGN